MVYTIDENECAFLCIDQLTESQKVLDEKGSSLLTNVAGIHFQ